MQVQHDLCRVPHTTIIHAVAKQRIGKPKLNLKLTLPFWFKAERIGNREDHREMFATSDGHILCCSGGTSGTRGVAILIHAKWAKSILGFISINERVAYVDMTCGGKNIEL